jgi:hypothetical protein
MKTQEKMAAIYIFEAGGILTEYSETAAATY